MIAQIKRRKPAGGVGPRNAEREIRIAKKGKNGKNKNNPLGKKSGRAGKRNDCTNKKKKACRNKDGCKWTKNGCKTKIRSVGKRNQDRQNSTLPSCFSKMFKYASKYKKAGNIFRQVKRTEGNKDKIEKKGKKKGDFNSTKEVDFGVWAAVKCKNSSCNFSGVGLQKLAAHLEKCHPGEGLENINIFCRVCEPHITRAQNNFEDEQELALHMEEKHGDLLRQMRATNM